MQFTLYTANTCQNKTNTVYPNCAPIACASDLRNAVAWDHVCAEYRGGMRNNQSFLSTDVVMLDCDNDHTEDPEAWVRPGDMSELLPGVAFVITPSRSNMLDKKGVSARPRWHIYFPIDSCTDPAAYTDLKRRIQRAYPFFDDNALDAARFVFGTHIRIRDILWHEADRTVDYADLAPAYSPEEKQFEKFDQEKLTQGKRNNGMHRFACILLKRFGETEESRNRFTEKNAKCCVPPLPEKELAAIWKSALKYYHTVVEKDPTYVSPESYVERFRNPLKPTVLSDQGQALILAREYKDRLIYTPQTEYLLYNGKVWEENEQGGIAVMSKLLDRQLETAGQVLDRSGADLVAATGKPQLLHMSANEIRRSVSPEHAELAEAYLADKAYRDFIVRYGNYKQYYGGLMTANQYIRRHINDMDVQPELLNTPGGTYDLSMGLAGRRDHNQEDRLTRITAFAPGEEGKELWEQNLQQTFCHDAELIEYVQQTVGLCAIGEVHQEAMVIAYGGGRNGKSTFWNTIARVLGSYSGGISADTLTLGCRRNVKPEFAELKGRRLAIAAELEEGQLLSTSTVKQLTSTDPIQAEQKYKAPFQFEPTHTLVLYTNHLPKVRALDEGTWRRLLVVPFNAVVPKDSDILNYSEYLLRNAGPAIMAWIIEGARKVIAAGYEPKKPRVVEEACAEYRGNNNWFAQFLEDTCETGPGLKVPSGKLYEAYRQWCERNGERIRHNSDFSQILEAAGYERRRNSAGIYYIGISVRSECLTEKDFLG